MPAPIRPGDTIALLAPASAVRRDYVEGAVETLHALGYRTCVYPSATGEPYGSFSAPEQVRLTEMLDALSDPAIAAVLCARGGYGCVHLLHHLNLKGSPRKWIIGFSDVSALHAWSASHGVAGMHASMAKHLALFGKDDPATKQLFRYLEAEPGTQITTTFPSSPLNRQGEARGVLAGGNLAVVNALADTPFDVLHPRRPTILLLEDVSEKIYAVERMLMRLYLSGVLTEGNIRGIIFGQFTDYTPDRNHNSMEEMIASRLDSWDIPRFPIVFNAPFGHIDTNQPIGLGLPTSLSAGAETVTLKQVID